MLAAIASLVALHATLIAVKEADAVCPSSREVSEAIEARLPGLLVPADQGSLPDALVLVLAPDATTGARGFTLVDHDERIRLRRELPPPATAAERECPALAETVALMVERYLQDLAYHGEAPPSPERRRWDLFAGATWRPGAGGFAAYELRLGGGRVVGRRLALALVAGIEGASQQDWPGVTGHLRRFPAELRLLWRAALGPTSLEAGPFAGLHLVVLDSRAGRRSATNARWSPVAGLVAGLRFPVGKLVFARLVGTLGVTVLRYDFVTGEEQKVAFGTERLWGKMGLEAGFSFW
jgi:hypothetical protein